MADLVRTLRVHAFAINEFFSDSMGRPAATLEAMICPRFQGQQIRGRNDEARAGFRGSACGFVTGPLPVACGALGLFLPAGLALAAVACQVVRT
ncbi:hypothetical protein [Streptomyces sp. f150]|uniref:hypothetical protein n=1 Tax=Streptomyces sp. f150 TaxID=1827699 RepID=UPI00118075F8|nr:hypothetical protein [Streptomyces sp. f150]